MLGFVKGSGKHADGDVVVFPVGPELFKAFEAVHDRHVDVEENEIGQGVERIEDAQRFLAVAGDLADEAGIDVAYGIDKEQLIVLIVVS